MSITETLRGISTILILLSLNASGPIVVVPSFNTTLYKSSVPSKHPLGIEVILLCEKSTSVTPSQSLNASSAILLIPAKTEGLILLVVPLFPFPLEPNTSRTAVF